MRNLACLFFHPFSCVPLLKAQTCHHGPFPGFHCHNHTQHLVHGLPFYRVAAHEWSVSYARSHEISGLNLLVKHGQERLVPVQQFGPLGFHLRQALLFAHYGLPASINVSHEKGAIPFPSLARLF